MDGIEFRGRLERVEATPIKEAPYGEPKGGDLRLTVTVPRPRPISGPPSPPYAVVSRIGSSPAATPESARAAAADRIEALTAAGPDYARAERDLEDGLDPEATAAERAEALEAGRAEAHALAREEHRDVVEEASELVKMVEEWADEVRAWEERESSGALHRRYAAVAGVGMLLIGEEVAITIAPDTGARRRMLPGFSTLELLSRPDGDEPDAAPEDAGDAP